MKIKGEKYEIMRAAMRAVIDCLGGPRAIKRELGTNGLNPTRMLWILWNVASDNIRYDDNHPNIRKVDGKRLIPQHPDFDVYDNEIYDVHIETALKTICKELSLRLYQENG